MCLCPYAFATGPVRRAILLIGAIALLYAAALVITAWGEPEAVVADALAGRWLVVVCWSGAVGLFSRHIAALRRASEHRFRRGFEDSPVGMATCHGDWRWQEVNDALCRMLGRAREELIGRSPAEVTHPDDIAKSRAVVDRACAGPRAPGLRQALCPAGRRARLGAVESTSSPERHGAGWFYAHVIDITAQRAAQAAVARQARQQAAVAALGRFALAEHDLEAVMDRVAETSPRRSGSSSAPSTRSRRAATRCGSWRASAGPRGSCGARSWRPGRRRRSATRSSSRAGGHGRHRGGGALRASRAAAKRRACARA